MWMKEEGGAGRGWRRVHSPPPALSVWPGWALSAAEERQNTWTTDFDLGIAKPKRVKVKRGKLITGISQKKRRGDEGDPTGQGEEKEAATREEAGDER